MHPQRANVPLQGLDRRALIVGAISGPHSQPGALLWRHFTILGFAWSTKSIQGKQTTESTLASGGSEHAWLFRVAISWGNKMNFSLSANMSGFCSDSHIY